MRRIAFVSYDFTNRNLRKQPWNYVWRICMGLSLNDHYCVVITDGNNGATSPIDIGGLPVYQVDKIRPQQCDKILEILNKEKIDLVLWSFTPKSIVFYKTFRKIALPIVLFISLPLYTFQEVMRAQLFLGKYNLFQYFQNCLVPKIFVRKVIGSDPIRAIITLSCRNRDRLVSSGCKKEKVWVVPHDFSSKHKTEMPTYNTIDLDETNQPQDVSSHQEKERIALYLGGSEKIRGLHWLIRAFGNAIKKNKTLRLIVLLRTDEIEYVKEIQSEMAKSGILERSVLVDGVLSERQVKDYLDACDFVVLPFVLVPSEVPISIFEAMQAGKPIVGTNVDGIPELISSTGIAVTPGDTAALTKAILRLAADDTLRDKLSNNCRTFMNDYPTWDEIDQKVSNLLDKA